MYNKKMASGEVWSHADIKRLIQLYKERGMLWEVKHKDYHNKDIRRAALQDIAALLNRTEKSVEIKLKSLRTYFTDQLKREKIDCTHTSRWPYYKCMHFLRETCMARQAKTTLAQKIEAFEADMQHQHLFSQIMEVGEFKSENDCEDGEESPHSSPGSPIVYQSMGKHSGTPMTSSEASMAEVTVQDLSPNITITQINNTSNRRSKKPKYQAEDRDMLLEDGIEILPSSRQPPCERPPSGGANAQTGQSSQYHGFAEFIEHSLQQLHPDLQPEAFFEVHKVIFEYQRKSQHLYMTS